MSKCRNAQNWSKIYFYLIHILFNKLRKAFSSAWRHFWWFNDSTISCKKTWREMKRAYTISLVILYKACLVLKENFDYWPLWSISLTKGFKGFKQTGKKCTERTELKIKSKITQSKQNEYSRKNHPHVSFIIFPKTCKNLQMCFHQGNNTT